LSAQTHFTPIIQPHTDRTLGHCSYLNTCARRHALALETYRPCSCYRPDVCRYLHFELEDPGTERYARDERAERQRQADADAAKHPKSGLTPSLASRARLPAQWLDCDLRALDMSALSKFEVVMCARRPHTRLGG
jgi:mRNA (2'-O-methyladenosine-N6-)-methyltransferase